MPGRFPAWCLVSIAENIMGRRGPLPKPSAVLRISGSWRAEDRAQSEVTAPAGEPDMPERIAGSEPHAAVWRETVALVSRVPGLLSVNDGEILACYCDAKVEYETAMSKLQEEGNGEVLADHNGRAYLNPWVSIRNKARDRMGDFWKRFGLSPADRANLKLEAPGEVDEYAGGGRKAAP